MPVVVLRSDVRVVAETVAKVIKSTQVELSVECCTFTVTAVLRVFVVTWRLATLPFALEALLSTAVPFVVVV